MRGTFFIILILLMVPSLAAAQNDTSNGNATASATVTTSTVQSQNQNGNQNQVQSNNPDNGTQTESQTQSRVQSPSASVTHSPVQLRQNTSIENRTEVANAVQALNELSYRIENNGLGTQIRAIAQAQSQNNQSIEGSIDKASLRSNFAKFFIGTNYKELKNVRQTMDQNRLQIENLNQLLAQITNESEAQNLQSQIEILEQQQTLLQNDIDEMGRGFSLFGWLNRLINNY